MASTQTWSEFNGTTAATESAAIGFLGWMASDLPDTTGIIYKSHPITAGANSFTKYQALVFGGTWNSLSAFTYKVSSAAPGTGLSVVASVVTAGTTPSASASGDSAASTSGTTANFNSSTTPYGAGTSSSTAGGTMYVNAYRTQLQTTTSAAPGDISAVTITASWTES